METDDMKHRVPDGFIVQLLQSPSSAARDAFRGWVRIAGNHLQMGLEEDEYTVDLLNEEGAEFAMTEIFERELNTAEVALLEAAILACAGVPWLADSPVSTLDGNDRTLCVNVGDCSSRFAWNAAPAGWEPLDALSDVIVQLAGVCAPVSADIAHAHDPDATPAREVTGSPQPDSSEVLLLSGEMAHRSIRVNRLGAVREFWVQSVDYSAAEMFDEPVVEHWAGPFDSLAGVLDGLGDVWWHLVPAGATRDARQVVLQQVDALLLRQTQEVQSRVGRLRQEWANCEVIAGDV